MNKQSEKVEGLSQFLEKYKAEEGELSVPEGSYSIKRTLEKFKIRFSTNGKSFCIKRPVGPDAQIHRIKRELQQLGFSYIK